MGRLMDVLPRVAGPEESPRRGIWRRKGSVGPSEKPLYTEPSVGSRKSLVDDQFTLLDRHPLVK